jgi:putative pyruvate formate lyase activating enzyme
MPNHIDCCTKKILEWIKKEIPNSAVNLMDQYKPEYKANDYKDINRFLSKNEYEKARNIGKNLNLFLI